MSIGVIAASAVIGGGSGGSGYTAEVAADSPILNWRTAAPATVPDMGSTGTGWSWGSGHVFGQTPVVPDGGTSVLPGTGGTLIRPDNPTMYTTGTWSWEGWLDIPAGNVYITLLGGGNTGLNGIYFYVGGNSNGVGRGLWAFRPGIAWTQLAASIGTSAGQYHVVLTGTGSTVTAYVNGTSVFSGSVSRNTPATLGMTILAPAGDANSLRIKADRVSIFNTVLSAARVTAHYNAGAGSSSAVAADSPIHHFEFDGGSGGFAESHRVSSTATGGMPADGSVAPTGATSMRFASGQNLFTSDQPTLPNTFAFEVVLKADLTTQVEPISSTNNSGPNELERFTISTTGVIQATAFHGSGYRTVSTAAGAFTANTWHHVVVGRQTDGFLRIYVDGSLVATSATADTNAYGSTRRYYVHGGFAGVPNTTTAAMEVAEIAVYGTSLSGSRIAAHYTALTA